MCLPDAIYPYKKIKFEQEFFLEMKSNKKLEIFLLETLLLSKNNDFVF